MSSSFKHFWKQRQLWLMVLPGLLFLLVFKYYPMLGSQIAFKNFKPTLGIWASQWIGFEHFLRFFNSSQFWMLIRNTLSISIYQLFAGFPIPILFALLVNNLPSLRFKKLVQTVTYAPHFISVVVLVGMMLIFLSPSGSFFPALVEQLTGQPLPILMGTPKYIPHIYVWSGIWQSMGWDSIVYIAALSAVPMDMHEAAIVDGASKFKRTLFIDLPSLLPTAVTLLILNCGKIMSLGFEKMLLMQNPANLEATEIISTYVYKVGLVGGQYSFSTAVGLFNSVINLVLILAVNRIAKRWSEVSLW